MGPSEHRPGNSVDELRVDHSQIDNRLLETPAEHCPSLRIARIDHHGYLNPGDDVVAAPTAAMP